MMDRFEVVGGIPLKGTVKCSGAKNATLPLMAAAVLADGVTIINGVPDLEDIRTMAMVLRVIGADVKYEDGQITIDASHCNYCEAPYELVRKMRASFYVLGPLLARHGEARVSMPGGCALGPRPVDLHIKAMEKLGCIVEIDAGYVVAKVDQMRGAKIHFDVSSVGVTGNVLMAAQGADGITVIENAACEPDIVDLANMLNAMGAHIKGAGTGRITIEGPTKLNPVEWTVIPDRIEAGTLLIATAATKGNVTVENCRSDHIEILLDKLIETGVGIEISENSVKIDATGIRSKSVDLTTEIYPGFPTDLQAPWSVLMSIAEGDSAVTDTIYPDRFTHIPELMRLGAQIRKKLNTSFIRGVEKLKGASIMCSDIRAGAAIVIAALVAEGESDILRIYHIDRGYEKFEDKLNQLGGEIRRISE